MHALQLTRTLGWERIGQASACQTDADLTAELKRALSFIHHEKMADETPSRRARGDEKAEDPPNKVADRSTHSACAGHRPNREEYQHLCKRNSTHIARRYTLVDEWSREEAQWL
jgi:hypothetical protein